MNLHENKKLFTDAVLAASEYLDIRPVYIEKDYWITRSLKLMLQNSDADKAIFKGGTSLSKAESRWGDGFFKNLSRDMQNGVRGFSEKNLYYMKLMYLLYRELFEKFPQDVGKINNHDLFNPNDLFSISWSHHRYIIDKCKKDTNKALFYVRKTLENNWSRSVLLNFLDTDIL